MQTFPVFVINLPKDIHRREFQEEQLTKLGFSYSVIQGFLGDDVHVAESYSEELALKEHGKPLMKGEKGCAFSHRFIYEKMLQENIEVALILEDDVLLPSNFKEIVQKEVGYIDRFDWLSFDYPKIGIPFILAWIKASIFMTKKNPFFFFYAFLKFPFIVAVSFLEVTRNILAKTFPEYRGPKLFYRPLYNAGAYLITKEGIKKMQPLLYPIRFSADRTPNIARLKGLKMRWYVPQIVRQRDEVYESNTIY